jgi:LCP family protein required for cell wall assembly
MTVAASVIGVIHHRLARLSSSTLRWRREYHAPVLNSRLIRTAAVVSGVLLVMGGVASTQVQRSLGAVSVETFDLDETTRALGTIPDIVRDAAIAAVESAELTDATIPAGLEPVALPDTQNLATLSPALPDEMFDTYLLLGTDKNGLRADVVMMLLLPSDGSGPILVSLPRDLYVENPCTGRYARLNSGMNGCGADVSGATLIAASVRMFTGIRPDHFIVADFDGFEDVVDAIGGVEICFEYAVSDRDAGLALAAGCQRLSGAETLAWVRSRKTKYNVGGSWTSLGSDDFSRQAHQREVLFALVSEVARFSSITRLFGVAEEMASSLTISDDLLLSDLVALGWINRGITPADVMTLSIPTKSYITQAGAFVEQPIERFNDTLSQLYPAAYREVLEPNS